MMFVRHDFFFLYLARWSLCSLASFESIGIPMDENVIGILNKLINERYDTRGAGNDFPVI